jgi:hypothetical protein
MTRGDLLVDVRELAAGVFQEEFPLEGVDPREQIHEQNAEPSEDDGAISMSDNVFIRDEEFQFIHEPEAKSEQDGDGEDECVREHCVSLASERSRKWSISFRPFGSGERAARREQRRPSRSAPAISRNSVDEVGCGARWDEGH